MKKTVAVLLLSIPGLTLLLAQNKASWSKEPDSFRGAKFLSSESDVRSAFDVGECRNYWQRPDEKLCYFTFALADKQILGMLTFYKDTLVDVSGLFSPGYFSPVRDVFIERYGPASSSSDVKLSWSGRSVAVQLNKAVPQSQEELVATIGGYRYSIDLDSKDKEYKRRSDLNTRIYKIHLDLVLSQFRIDFDEHKSEEAMKQANHENEEADKKLTSDNERMGREATAELAKFKAGSYSSFSLTRNDYAAQAAKRKSDEKKKSADAL